MSCNVCATNGTTTSTAGQCIRCRTGLCINHAEELQTVRIGGGQSCPHTTDVAGGASAA